MHPSATPIADDRQLRLIRLLGFLDSDRGNDVLMSDALSLAIELRHFPAAESIVTLASLLPKRTPALNANLCLYHLIAGQPDAALNAGREAHGAGLRSAAHNTNTAWAAFRCGCHAEAVARLDDVFPDPRTTPLDVNLLRARALHHLGKLASARESLSRPSSHEDVPAAQRAELAGLRALIAIDMGDTDNALAHAREALAEDAHQSDALLALGDALKELGDFGNARTAFELLTTLRPDTGRAWSGLAQVHLSGLQFAQSEHCAQRATAHMPNHIGTWHVLGWARLLQGNCDGAREAFSASLPLERGFADTHGALAAVEFSAGRREQAEQHLKVAERLDRHSAAVQYAAFLKLLTTQGADTARAFLAQQLDSNPAGATSTLRELVNARAQELLAQRSQA